MKINRCGKAEILSNEDYNKIKSVLASPRDKLICAILFYTGERIGAVVQLKVSDVYADPGSSRPAASITFAARTRKGKADTRQVPTHSALREILETYQPPLEGYLFPSPRDGSNHLTKSAFDKLFRSALDRAGLHDAGISSHSFRRTFITRLHDAGNSIKVIQHITRHRSLQSLAEYIEVRDQQVRDAVSALPIA